MSEKNKQFKEVIKAYLDKRAQEDELFAKAYAKPQKCIEACCKYIISMARKLGNAVAVPDEVVYGWAVHYYDEEGIKVDDAEKVCEVKVERPEPRYPEAKPKKEKQKKHPIAVDSPFVQLSLF